MAPKVASKPAQDFVPIKEVRDGIGVLKDGSYVMVLIGSSLNFALKSADEQTAIISQFQNFLNSLDFTVQILVQSRRLDIRPYLATLDDRLKDQTNELLKVQIREYIGFVRNFTESTSIMSKSFFIVVPYTPPPTLKGPAGIFSSLFGKKDTQTQAEQDDERARFEENRTQLEQRVNVVESGLVRAGVRTAVLGTEELVELFFKMLNPGEIVRPVLNQ